MIGELCKLSSSLPPFTLSSSIIHNQLDSSNWFSAKPCRRLLIGKTNKRNFKLTSSQLFFKTPHSSKGFVKLKQPWLSHNLFNFWKVLLLSRQVSLSFSIFGTFSFSTALPQNRKLRFPIIIKNRKTFSSTDCVKIYQIHTNPTKNMEKG